MTDLSEQARAILDAGRALDNPSSAARERARRAVMARIAAAGAVTAFSTGVTAAAVPAAKVVVPLILVLAGGVGGGLLWRAEHRAPTNQPAVAVAVRTAPSVMTPPGPPAAAPAAPFPAQAPEPPVPPARAQRWRQTKTRAAVASVHRPAAAPPGDGLQDETALLARVNAALRAGDTGRGLVLLDEYDHRFPSGVLHEETTATRIIARCQAGDDGARDAARRFVEQHPRSPLSSRVRSSCLIKPAR